MDDKMISYKADIIQEYETLTEKHESVNFFYPQTIRRNTVLNNISFVGGNYGR